LIVDLFPESFKIAVLELSSFYFAAIRTTLTANWIANDTPAPIAAIMPAAINWKAISAIVSNFLLSVVLAST
jgi:hypothetical protein